MDFELTYGSGVYRTKKSRTFESSSRFVDFDFHFFNPTKSRLKFDFFRLSSTFIFFDRLFFVSTFIDFNRLFHQKSKSRSKIFIFCNPGVLVTGAKCSAVKSQSNSNSCTCSVSVALALQIQLADFFSSFFNVIFHLELEFSKSRLEYSKFNCLVVEASRFRGTYLNCERYLYLSNFF
jgi:hypothetical protein